MTVVAPHLVHLPSGVIAGGLTSRRLLGELGAIFADPVADSSDVVYETYGPPYDDADTTSARLLVATTRLMPGEVNGEFYMTRGHFHAQPQRGETCLTLAGSGLLLLMSRDGETIVEEMTQGSLHDIDGRYAHRVVNTGDVPLVFYVTWMSDCGHDYESISQRGFGVRVFSGPNGPMIKSTS